MKQLGSKDSNKSEILLTNAESSERQNKFHKKKIKEFYQIKVVNI